MLRLERISKALSAKHQSLAATWSDSKYRELGAVVNDCSSAIATVTQTLSGIGRQLAELTSYIREYESVNFSDSTGSEGTSRDGVSVHSAILSAYAGLSESSSDGAVNQILSQYVSRSLSTTQQGWENLTGNRRRFDTPIETGSSMIAQQGEVRGFQGTCGLVACANLLRLAGVNVAERDLVTYASATRRQDGSAYLCRVDLLHPRGSGGTTQWDREEILTHFGMSSEFRPATVDNIRQAVTEGRGVIASVHAQQLYDGVASRENDLHAVAVTSVVEGDGQVVGVYLCDSNNRPASYYPIERFEAALNHRTDLNVTSTIIR